MDRVHTYESGGVLEMSCGRIIYLRHNSPALMSFQVINTDSGKNLMMLPTDDDESPSCSVIPIVRNQNLDSPV